MEIKAKMDKRMIRMIRDILGSSAIEGFIQEDDGTLILEATAYFFVTYHKISVQDAVVSMDKGIYSFADNPFEKVMFSKGAGEAEVSFKTESASERMDVEVYPFHYHIDSLYGKDIDDLVGVMESSRATWERKKGYFQLEVDFYEFVELLGWSRKFSKYVNIGIRDSTFYLQTVKDGWDGIRWFGGKVRKRRHISSSFSIQYLLNSLKGYKYVKKFVVYGGEDVPIKFFISGDGYTSEIMVAPFFLD